MTNNNEILQLMLSLKEDVEKIRGTSEKQVERIIRQFERGKFHIDEVAFVTGKDKAIAALAESLHWNLYVMIPIVERLLDTYSESEKKQLIIALQKMEECVAYTSLKQDVGRTGVEDFE